MENGFRPFQKETIDAIKNPNSKIIIVEAPVGSGKSYIIRNLIQDDPDFFKRKPIILTYPTKILMDAQVSALRQELSNTSIWPFNSPSANAINIFYYSSSSLVSYLLKQDPNFIIQKSDLINEMIREFGYLSNKSMVVTSPDVLHLLVNRKAYKGSKRIQNLLNGAYIFFDEFHLYSNLKNFPILIQNLLEGMAAKIIFLSATPYQNEELKQIIEKNQSKFIDFKNSQTDNKGTIFNYPLDVEICSFKYTDLNQNLNKLIEIIPKSEKPMAIIFDSVFRLQRIKKDLEKAFSDEFKIIEWSGFKKDNVMLIDEKTIVLGTSSIEVGIDMYFKTLITEVSYWTSAIQRIGRVGRKCDGKVIIFTNKNFAPYLNKEELDRDEFENMVLKEALKDPSDKMIAGEMFRGDSYNFLILDEESKQEHIYSEALFAMFAITDKIDDWRQLDFEGKKDALEYMGIHKNQKEYLLHDKIFPFWGIVKGKLKNKYSRVNAIYSENDNELIITDSDDNSHTFYDYQGLS